MTYSIGDLASMLNINPSTIRYYEKEGLLTDIKRVSGIRRFKEKDKEDLMVIEFLKETGMSLKDIKVFLKCHWDEEQRRVLFDKQKKMIENEISQLQKQLDFIDQNCLSMPLGRKKLGMFSS